MFKMDFIGIGAPRCGTTWLARALEEHPGICFSNEKEINFFNRELFWIKNWKSNYESGLDWYRGFFAHYKEGQIRGEFSVSYLYDTAAPDLIKKHFPDTKIIVMLRHPVEQIFSYYQFNRFEYDFPDFDKMINDESFIRYGRYSRYLKKYLELFDREQIRVLFYDDMLKDPRAFISGVYGFLGVDDSFVPECLEKRINPAGDKLTLEAGLYYSIRNRIRSFLADGIRKYRVLKKILVYIDIGLCQMLRLIGRRGKQYKSMPENTRKALLETYGPSVGELERMLGRSLSAWKE